MEVTEVKAVTLLLMGKMLPFMAVAVKEVLAAVAEVPVIMDERVSGVSYLTPVNASKYMIKMLISILLIQNFRKRG